MDYNGGENNYRDMQSMHDRCRKCMTFHVVITLKDGAMVEGIIEGVDRENVNLLVAEPAMVEEDLSCERQEFGYGGQGRPRRRRPRRRFRRRSFPLALLAGLDVIPFFSFFPFFPF